GAGRRVEAGEAGKEGTGADCPFGRRVHPQLDQQCGPDRDRDQRATAQCRSGRVGANCEERRGFQAAQSKYPGGS
ncbi:MAG: hypothetical protein WA687_02635, partial [Solirubrobacterales bacterium]